MKVFQVPYKLPGEWFKFCCKWPDLGIHHIIAYWQHKIPSFLVVKHRHAKFFAIFFEERQNCTETFRRLVWYQERRCGLTDYPRTNASPRGGQSEKNSREMREKALWFSTFSYQSLSCEKSVSRQTLIRKRWDHHSQTIALMTMGPLQLEAPTCPRHIGIFL